MWEEDGRRVWSCIWSWCMSWVPFRSYGQDVIFLCCRCSWFDSKSFSDPLFESSWNNFQLLRFPESCLILTQRKSEWISHSCVLRKSSCSGGRPQWRNSANQGGESRHICRRHARRVTGCCFEGGLLEFLGWLLCHPTCACSWCMLKSISSPTVWRACRECQDVMVHQNLQGTTFLPADADIIRHRSSSCSFWEFMVWICLKEFVVLLTIETIPKKKKNISSLQTNLHQHFERSKDIHLPSNPSTVRLDSVSDPSAASPLRSRAMSDVAISGRCHGSSDLERRTALLPGDLSPTEKLAQLEGFLLQGTEVLEKEALGKTGYKKGGLRLRLTQIH